MDASVPQRDIVQGGRAGAEWDKNSIGTKQWQCSAVAGWHHLVAGEEAGGAECSLS